MVLKPLFLLVEVFFADFISHKIKASIIGGNSGGATAQMRVKNLESRLCIVFENPLVQGDWLLRGMDFIARPVVKLK